MELKTKATIIDKGYGAVTIGYNTVGYSINEKVSEPIELKRKQVTFSYDVDTFKSDIKKYQDGFNPEWYNEIMLHIFKENCRDNGRLSALKNLMDDGYILGFHYDLMGCGEFVRMNKKSITMTDICDNKHYITYDYFKNEIQMNQFYVTH